MSETKIVSYPEGLCSGLCEEFLGGDDAGVWVLVEEFSSLTGTFSLRLLPEHNRVLQKPSQSLLFCGLVSLTLLV